MKQPVEENHNDMNKPESTPDPQELERKKMAQRDSKTYARFDFKSRTR